MEKGVWTISDAAQQWRKINLSDSQCKQREDWDDKNFTSYLVWTSGSREIFCFNLLCFEIKKRGLLLILKGLNRLLRCRQGFTTSLKYHRYILKDSNRSLMIFQPQVNFNDLAAVTHQLPIKWFSFLFRTSQSDRHTYCTHNSTSTSLFPMPLQRNQQFWRVFQVHRQSMPGKSLLFRGFAHSVQANLLRLPSHYRERLLIKENWAQN